MAHSTLRIMRGRKGWKNRKLLECVVGFVLNPTLINYSYNIQYLFWTLSQDTFMSRIQFESRAARRWLLIIPLYKNISYATASVSFALTGSSSCTFKDRRVAAQVVSSAHHSVCTHHPSHQRGMCVKHVTLHRKRSPPGRDKTGHQQPCCLLFVAFVSTVVRGCCCHFLFRARKCVAVSIR